MGSESSIELNLMAAASLDEKRAAMKAQDEALKAKVEQLQQHLAIVSAALKVLSVRALTFISLLGGLGLFAWCVAEPDTGRIVATALYAALVFLPTLYWARATAKGD